MKKYTHSGGKSIRPITKDPRRQMWFTIIQILNRRYHARGTKNNCHYRWSVHVSSGQLFRSTQGPGKELAMKLKEYCGNGEFSRTSSLTIGRGDILASKAVNNEAFCIIIDLECPFLSLKRSGIKKSRICLSSCMTIP